MSPIIFVVSLGGGLLLELQEDSKIKEVDTKCKIELKIPVEVGRCEIAMTRFFCTDTCKDIAQNYLWNRNSLLITRDRRSNPLPQRSHTSLSAHLVTCKMASDTCISQTCFGNQMRFPREGKKQKQKKPTNAARKILKQEYSLDQ